MMLIGYVSDEMYAAIPDVMLEFRNGTESYEARSRASGAVHANVPPGQYEVFLQRTGYGPKRVQILIDPNRPCQFRLLSDRLVGYVWPKWVRVGETAEVRIHSPETYTLDLWRYGWEKELTRHIGRFENHPRGATRQVLPDGDFTQTGVGWNHSGYADPPTDDRRLVKAPRQSGLYYFHARTASGVFFSFPWVIAPARGSADIAVLASNLTWHTYNDYGGRSNYISAVHLPPTPSVNPHQEQIWFRQTGADFWVTEDYKPLSFDRPEPLNLVEENERITDPITRIGAEHVAPAEWRLLGWLEREGFAYDLYADTQLHAGLLNLDDYRVLILNTHPEYWSREMYERVKSWVFERGGRLMYLGGNGINCSVDFLDDSTVIVRNGDCSEFAKQRKLQGYAAKLPSRFGMKVEEESHLLGVVTTLTGMGTGAPYRVLDASHWVFDGSGLKNGDLVGEQSLDMRNPGGASGHETDKMSAQSPRNARLLAKGINPDSGGGEMVYFETPSGGSVFSVGSISFTCSIAVDEGISKITANVLHRFLNKS